MLVKNLFLWETGKERIKCQVQCSSDEALTGIVKNNLHVAIHTSNVLMSP